MCPTPDGRGYWLVGVRRRASSASVTPRYYGSVPGLGDHMSNIVGMATTPDGRGYWLVGVGRRALQLR